MTPSEHGHPHRRLTNLGSGAYNAIVQANDRGIIYAGASIDNPGGGLVIAPWKSNTSGIRLDPNGNVGIGMANPSEALDVNGNIHTVGGLLVSNNILFFGSLQNTASGRTVADSGGCYYGP